jgi:hypothetical protein
MDLPWEAVQQPGLEDFAEIQAGQPEHDGEPRGKSRCPLEQLDESLQRHRE